MTMVHFPKSKALFGVAVFSWMACVVLHGAKEEVFSGPQKGEQTPPFFILDLLGPGEGEERDVIAEHHGATTTLVFVHGVERSMAPLMRVIDQYGHEERARMKTEFIFLSEDPLAGQQRFPRMARALAVNSRVGLSLEGAEGPGNYGLNKECLLTIVVARDDRVTDNFALVQPGIADAQKVLNAMARAMGAETNPDPEALLARQQNARNKHGERPAARRRPGDRRGEQTMKRPDAYALETTAGLRSAVKDLLEEVARLRTELAEMKGGVQPAMRSDRQADEDAGQPRRRARTPLPGAAPTDPELVAMLRRFIQKSNEPATVDKIMHEVRGYIEGDKDLTRQAIDGWTRVLHLSYGTEYARQAGQTLVDELMQTK